MKPLPTDLAVGALFALIALWLIYRIWRAGRRERLSPPHHHTKRRGPEALP